MSLSTAPLRDKMSFMATIVLAGGPAAGKTTLARTVAAERQRSAVIDVDEVRWMLLQPHVAPWGGAEGRRQQMLGVKNACGLAKSFIDDGCDVIVTDVLTDDTASRYRRSIPEMVIVRLKVDLTVALERSDARGWALTRDEFEMMHRAQETYTAFDLEIDTTASGIETLVAEVNTALESA